MVYPCDAHLPDAERILFRAVDVGAPPSTVFRWLCQLKVAPYGYDPVDNFGRASPRVLTSGTEQLARGQRVMTIFELTDFETDRHLTMRLASRSSILFGEIALTYQVARTESGNARLVVKLRVKNASVFSKLTGGLLAWGDLVMMRKQLLTLKRLSEQS